MHPALIFLPSVAMVFLTGLVSLKLFIGRVQGIKEHKARVQAIADPQQEEKVFHKVINTSDNFENLFEMPVLFYAVTIIIFILGIGDGIYMTLAWLYVAFRFAHSYIHCTSNRIKYRFRYFGFSATILYAMWIRLGFQILMLK